MSVAVATLNAVAAINAAASSGTTGSYSPHAGSSYIVCVGLVNGAQTAIPSSTVAWASGGSGAWSKLASLTVDQFSPALELWRCTCSTAPGASTISVTGNATVGGVFASTTEVTGDNVTQPGVTANTSGGSTTAQAITPGHTGSLCFQLGIDTFEGFTPTANAASTLISGWNDSGQELWSTVTNSNTTASTPVTVGLTNTPSAGSTYMLAVEVVPAPSAARKRPALVVPSQAVIRAATW